MSNKIDLQSLNQNYSELIDVLKGKTLIPEIEPGELGTPTVDSAGLVTVEVTKGGRIRLMTDEEAVQFPWKILGVVSSVPEYKIWGEKEIEVNGRVWIKVR